MTWAISSGVAISCSSNTAGPVGVMASTRPAILLLPRGQSLRSGAPKSGMADALAAEAALGVGLVRLAMEPGFTRRGYVIGSTDERLRRRAFHAARRAC